MERLMSICTVFLLLLVGAQWVQADVITIEPSKDNTLYQDAAGSLSNGAGGNFFVGKTAAGVIRRGLLAFDIISHIPPGSTINSVSLTLHMSRTSSGSQLVSLHKVLADWGEGTSVAPRGGGGGGPATSADATWLHTFYDTDFWDNAGGDFADTQSATTDVNDEGFYTWGSTPQMIADVQSWLDNPASDFGWILVGNEAHSRTSKRFDSRDNATPALRPMLTINFTALTTCAERITSDLNNDCIVDFRDFVIFASEWLESSLQPTEPATIHIEGIGEFGFSPADVQTVRSDIFKSTHFSIFDILVHLDKLGSIDMAYHFDENMNTHVIDSINGIENWWYRAYYDGGWPENNVFRMDHYPYKEKMYIELMQKNPGALANIYAVHSAEIERKKRNNGKVIIPEVIIRGTLDELHFFDVEVEPHNLRTDTFQEGVITGIDIIISLADQGKISYDLQWYDSIGTAEIVRSYWVERINEDQASGRCGFVYETGARGISGNHIHIPSDFRVINSPEYAEWFWIQLGPCE